MMQSQDPKFRYVSAAVFPANHYGLGVYVRYHRVNNIDIVVKEYSSRHVWLDTPDRELLMVGDANRNISNRPLNENWDEFISISPGYSSFEDSPMEWFMLNYVQHEKHHSANLALPHSTQYRKRKILADSGGFQIGKGVRDFVDPLAIVEWYNKNTDVGMILDIPLLLEDRDLLMQAAKMQRKNTASMLANKAEHVELMNVVHGESFKDFCDFHDVVQEPSINKISIAGMYKGYFMQSIARYMQFIDHIQDRYDHVHLLGIRSLNLMFPLIRAASFGDKLVTSDSSAWLQSSNGRCYHNYNVLNSTVNRIEFGIAQLRYPSSSRILTCTCPICTTIKYADIFSAAPSGVTSFLLGMHNMWVDEHFMLVTDDYARNMTSKQYVDFVIRQFKHSGGSYNEVVDAVKMVDRVAHDGIKALSKYQYSLSFVGDKKFTTVGFDGKVHNPHHDPEVELKRKRLQKLLTDFGKYTDTKTKRNQEKKRGIHASSKRKKKR